MVGAGILGYVMVRCLGSPQEVMSHRLVYEARETGDGAAGVVCEHATPVGSSEPQLRLYLIYSRVAECFRLSVTFLPVFISLFLSIFVSLFYLSLIFFFLSLCISVSLSLYLSLLFSLLLLSINPHLSFFLFLLYMYANFLLR